MSLLQKWATGRNIILLLVLFLLANLVVIPAIYPRFQTLDTLTTYTPSEAYRYISSISAADRQLYAVTELTLDLIYPLVSALLFSLLILYAFQRAFPQQAWLRFLALAPFGVLLADYLENACVLIMLWIFPKWMPSVAAAANVFTLTKLALTPLELTFVIGLAAWLVRTLRGRLALARA